MIDLYYWPTPNGHKITIFLEEAGLDYQIHPVHIGQGDQFKPEFLAIAPNNKMPAIVDHAPNDGGEPISLFESGAILEYLADKTATFLPQDDTRARFNVLQWLHWQMGGLGPMLGQNHHFNRYAPETIPYAVERYTKETTRLYTVLNRQLEGQDHMCGAYSIADMDSYPWIVPHSIQGQDLNEFPSLKAWFERISQRPAVQAAYRHAQNYQMPKEMTEAIRKNLFGQTDTKPAED